MDFQFTIFHNINLYHEFFSLAQSAAKYQGKFNPESYHLIQNSEQFSKSPEEIDKEFSDVYAYQVKVLEEAVPLFNDPFWGKLAAPLATGGYENSFLSAYALSNQLTSVNDLDYPAFMRLQMSAIETILYSIGVEDVDMTSFEEGSYGKSTWKEEIDIHLEDIFVLLNLLQISDELKIAILSIFSDSHGSHRLFQEKLRACEEIIMAHLPLIEERRKETLRLLQGGTYDEEIISLFSLEEFFEGSSDFLKEFIHKKTMHCSIWLGPVSYGGASLGMISVKDDNPFISIGLLLFPLQKYSLHHLKLSKERLIEQTKALGDSLRFDILQILQERPYYVKELAERLDISSPSLSHHLKNLLNTGFIHAVVNEQRMYYQINYETFEVLANYLLTIRRQEDGAE